MLNSPMFVPIGPTEVMPPSSVFNNMNNTFIPTGPSVVNSTNPFFVPTGPKVVSSPFSSPLVSDIFVSSDSPFLSSDPFISNNPFISSDPFIPTGPKIISNNANDLLFSPTFSPYPMTVSFDFDKPLLGVYETIDTNPQIRHRMIKYYYDLVRDSWLLDELNDVLNYYIYSDGKVHMIKSMSDYSPKNIAKDTDKIAEKKVEHIEETILTKYDMEEILNKFSRDTRIKFVDFPKNELLLRQAVKEYLMKQIKKKLKNE